MASVLPVEEQIAERAPHVVLRVARELRAGEIDRGHTQHVESLAPAFFGKIERAELAQGLELEIVAAPAIAQFLQVSIASADGSFFVPSSVSTRANDAFAATGRNIRLLQFAQACDRFVRVALRAQQLRLQQLGFGRFARSEHGRELIQRVVRARDIALRDAGFGAREPRAGLPQRRIATENALRRQEIAPRIAELAELCRRHAAPQRGVRIGAERGRRQRQPRVAMAAHHVLRRALHHLKRGVALEPLIVGLDQVDFAQRFGRELVREQIARKLERAPACSRFPAGVPPRLSRP